jgi:hypothetical protein
MFRKMKDSNNVFHEIVYDPNKNKSKVKKTQKEEYDGNILCEDCDNRILGIMYESYAQKAIYGGNLTEEVSPKCINYENPKDGTKYTICENFDYRIIKNFYLSILWRASITNRPFFSEVNLGNKHEERIRQILLNNELTDQEEYPIVITSFMRTENTLENIIAQPKRIITDSGLNGYFFLIDGLLFTIFVNSLNHPLPETIKKVALNENKMIIVHMRSGTELDFLRKIIKNK